MPKHTRPENSKTRVGKAILELKYSTKESWKEIHTRLKSTFSPPIPDIATLSRYGTGILLPSKEFVIAFAKAFNQDVDKWIYLWGQDSNSEVHDSIIVSQDITDSNLTWAHFHKPSSNGDIWVNIQPDKKHKQEKYRYVLLTIAVYHYLDESQALHRGSYTFTDDLPLVLKHKKLEEGILFVYLYIKPAASVSFGEGSEGIPSPCNVITLTSDDWSEWDLKWGKDPEKRLRTHIHTPTQKKNKNSI